jgi:hypothetical protein
MKGKESFCMKTRSVFISVAASFPPLYLSMVADSATSSHFEQDLLLIL